MNTATQQLVGSQINPAQVEELLAAADAARRLRRRWQSRRGLAVSLTVTMLWIIAVSSYAAWPRVLDNWVFSVMMVFGSLVAGSTPQGGGAVAFPVMTKALAVPSEVARSFALCIQAVGMGSATLAILLRGIRVEWRAIGYAGSAAVVGFALTLLWASDPSQPFSPALLAAAYVKVSFTIVLLVIALMLIWAGRIPLRELHRSVPRYNPRVISALLIAGLLGGVNSALVGSGADVMLFIVLAIFLAVDPRVAVPSSVVLMALLSVFGLVYLGVYQGQLWVALDPADLSQVLTVAGHSVGLPASRFDLLGFWLAAVPIVCWGAPIGAWLAAKVSARHLSLLVLLLALLEVLSTAIFLDSLRHDPWLLAYGLFGSIGLLSLIGYLATHRQRIFALPPTDLQRALSAERVDVNQHRLGSALGAY